MSSRIPSTAYIDFSFTNMECHQANINAGKALEKGT